MESRETSPYWRQFNVTSDLIGIWRKRNVAIPKEKLAKTQILVAAWLKADAKFSMKGACSLHGKLVHVSCVFPLIRPFLRGLSTFAGNFFCSQRAQLTPSKGVIADLQWVVDLLCLLPNGIPLCSPHPVDIGWWGDASTSFGIGITIGHFWAVWHWAPGFRVGPGQAFDIGWVEAVAVELGFHMALHLSLLVSQNCHEHFFFPGPFGQCRHCGSDQQRSFSQPGNQYCLEEHFCPPSQERCADLYRICPQPRKHCRSTLSWQHRGLFGQFSRSDSASLLPFTIPPYYQVDITVASAHSIITTHPSCQEDDLTPHYLPVNLHRIIQDQQPPPAPSPRNLGLTPSPFRPNCCAEERLFLWQGPNLPPPSTISHPVIEHLASLANRASLRDAASYGAGIRKFHLFCNIFSIPESLRLPASFELLHSFALWAVSDPSSKDSILSIPTTIPFKPVSINIARKYLSAVRAWHIAQGWPPPLSENDHKFHNRVNWSLRGLDNLLSSRRKPLRLTRHTQHFAALKATLILSDPFDACI